MAFAICCVNLYKHLSTEKKEFVLSKQLVRSGTSIGANVKEALRGQSRPDFGTKMNISLKEASESEFWIDILKDSEYINQQQADSMMNDCQELLKLLMSIIKTSKQ